MSPRCFTPFNVAMLAVDKGAEIPTVEKLTQCYGMLKMHF